MCLTSDFTNDGVIFIGDGPYQLYPLSDASTDLKYTPLLINPSSPTEYFIGVRSIKIDRNEVPITKSLLSFNNKGNGGVKLSTVHPYTIMESSIFKEVTTSIDNKLRKDFPNAKRINAIAPFEVCYDRDTLTFTRVGVEVPDIQLVLQNKNVVWTIYASNSMFSINGTAICLALVVGGKNPTTSIVMGGYQLEDNLLQFDLAKSRLGFRYLMFNTRCSNFNFTSIA